MKTKQKNIAVNATFSLVGATVTAASILGWQKRHMLQSELRKTKTHAKNIATATKTKAEEFASRAKEASPVVVESLKEKFSAIDFKPAFLNSKAEDELINIKAATEEPLEEKTTQVDSLESLSADNLEEKRA